MRDPRLQPMAGDVVAFGPQHQRERYVVDEVVGDMVFYFLDWRMNGVHFKCSMRQWREWNETGDVIFAAE